jgi:hypothetical protein
MFQNWNSKRPQPNWWAEEITQEEFDAFSASPIYLRSGFLFGPDGEEQRLHLLALLLKNCGVEAAAFLTDRDDWREATEHAFGASFE